MKDIIESIARQIRFGNAESIETMNITLAFASREDYLAWVSEWKARWHELVREIREEKAALRQPHVLPHSAILMSRRVRSRSHAHTMLLLRAAGKTQALRSRAQAA